MTAIPWRTGPRSARRAAACALGALLLFPPLAACTGGEERGTGQNAAAQSLALARRGQLKSGGSATWGVDRLPATLNAYQFEADEVTDQVAAAVLPMLFTVDAQGRPQLNPDYLRSAEVTGREPKQTVVYTLHPDAEWSDGTALGAADFVSQWKALNGEDKDFWSARNAGYDRVENVTEGPGRDQVEVTFAKPYADWKSLFSPLYPRSVTGDADRFNEGARTELPASAGPFELKKRDQKAGTLTLARNDSWWGDPALLDQLVLAAVPPPRHREALLEGRLDIAEVAPADADRITAAAGAPAAPARREENRDDAAGGDGTGAAAVEALHGLATARLAGRGERAAAEAYARALAERDRARERAFATREEADRERLRGFTVHRAYDASATHLALNGTSPALSDERVRWAVARAVDRAELAERVHEPAGLPARTLGSHLRVHGQAGYQDNSDALGETGAEAAGALLEEAGWQHGEVAARENGRADAEENGRENDRADADGNDRADARDNDRAGAGENDRAGAADDGRAPAAPPAVPVRAKDGEPLELRFVLPDGAAANHLRATGRRIVEMLAEAGVKARIDKVEAKEFFSDHIARGAFDLALFSWPATAYPATDAAPLFAKPRTLPGGEQMIEQNYTRVGTDYIDQLLAQAAGELEEKEHDRLLNRADARIWAAAGSIPLYQRPQLVAVREDLAGAGAFGLQTPRYQDIGYRR